VHDIHRAAFRAPRLCYAMQNIDMRTVELMREQSDAMSARHALYETQKEAATLRKTPALYDGAAMPTNLMSSSPSRDMLLPSYYPIACFCCYALLPLFQMSPEHYADVIRAKDERRCYDSKKDAMAARYALMRQQRDYAMPMQCAAPDRLFDHAPPFYSGRGAMRKPRQRPAASAFTTCPPRR